MCGQVKVLTLPMDQLAAIFRGETRLQLPHDAEIQAAIRVGKEFGFRIYSETYAYVIQGQQMPMVPAVLIRMRPKSE